MPASSPSREKDNRQPFPYTASPHRQTTLPSASSSSSSLPASTNPTTLTLESILALHASSSDPKLAGLEQALSERNVLSSQNSQLWKLIEKQRSGYNQIMKELERVRNERDTYKARLAVVAGGSLPAERRMPSRERSTKQSLDSSVSDAERDTVQNPRQNMTRYYSDDQVTPRTTSHNLHSREPISANISSSSLANSATSSSTSLNISHSRLPPLTVPPRPDALPELSATQESPLHSFNTTTPKYSHFAHGYNDSIISSLSYSSSSNTHGSSSSSRPHPRKSSFTESISSSSTNGAEGGVAYSGIAHYQSQHTPQTAPAEYSTNPLYTPVNSITAAPQIFTSVLTPTAAGRDPHTSPTSSKAISSTLSTLSPAMAVPLSRESRISLPDEAKQYIANMSDSPVSSPRMEMFNKAPSALSQSYVPSPPENEKDHEFLDMDEEEEADDDNDDNEEKSDEESDEEVDSAAEVLEDEVVDPTLSSEPTNAMPTTSFRFSQGPGPSAGTTYSTPTPARSTSNNINQPHTSDFALPSSSMISQHADARAEAVYQRQLTAEKSATQQLNDGSLPRLETQNLPSQSSSTVSPAGFFRALPLLSTDLPHTRITVFHSFVRPNDRGKEVLSFVVYVDPGRGKEGWKVEKMYSDVLNLDQRVRNSVGKSVGKKIAALPEGKLWKDHAPAKADQRKAVLESYLQTLINLPIKNNDEVIAFFTTDIGKDTMQPVMQVGHKEGYLTKRGKNFGGWKTRYFLLAGPVLEYYDARGGTHLGSITVAGAQIGRQQRTNTTSSTDEEKEYRHAFLIVEAKKGPGGNHPRHVLCAESDDERDSWVEILVRYFTGTYTEEPVAYGAVPLNTHSSSNTNLSQSQYANGANQAPASAAPRTSMSSSTDPARKPSRGFSKDDIPLEKRAIPLAQLPQDVSNAKLFDHNNLPSNSSPSTSMPIPLQGQAERERMHQGGQPSSLPDSSPLSTPSALVDPGQRANSEMGHYPEIQTIRGQQQRQSPDFHRSKQQRSNHGTSPVGTSPSESIPSPDTMDRGDGKVKISGPMNGAPIPAGYKFGGKDVAPTATTENGGNLATSSNDRREKAKSRSFWGFGRPGGDKGSNPNLPSATFVPRAVFGVSLEESLDVARIANLPAIVFRCIEYLEAKKADQEEGIYRLSGSSAVIKSLKDRFNAEGDVNLLASDEYWDPHAIAGLLKSFLRELPSSILTRDLHMRFLAVIDFVDPQERIRELSQLIASLPIANYSLLRALTAHLILVVQNSSVNKMTMRNVGIVFSPTLGIPAGVFSLMLGEFNRVFNVDAGEIPTEDDSVMAGSDRRNSVQYSEAAADKLLGLTGRSLKPPSEETQSDTDEYSVHGDESGTDPEVVNEALGENPGIGMQQAHLSPPDTPLANNNNKAGRASNLAAGRGLNIAVSDRGNRYSRMMGLPTSPRPPPSPGGHSSVSSLLPAQ
ncbi:hypothetical protein D9757_010037 [Collybiopsis confluens]|uniref:RhoGAP-domain-containing protein n=1 Tax=Collybiopsis confluens TaxID=2823264 RepID=A0A8H5GQJ6_9AGAR|nr:hypothetical protein D9757_010037 [Collybiopsis confluens]